MTPTFPARHRHGPMTAQMKGALHFLASRGQMHVCVANRFVYDEVSRRTAWSLERRGYAERHWTGGEDATIYITKKGQEASDALLSDFDEEDAAWES